MQDHFFTYPTYREFLAARFAQVKATRRRYYSGRNVLFCSQNGIATDGLQRPKNTKFIGGGLEQVLVNRRAGIEPLIGHVKEFGLKKSKMRSDRATLSSGYRSVTGFNLHQLIRHMDGKAA